MNLFKNTSSFFILYVVFLLLGGLSLWLYSRTDIFLFINLHYSSFADCFFSYYTNVGDGYFYAVIIIGLLFYRYKYALVGVLSFGISSLLVQVLKRYVFHEYRPTRFYQELNIKFHAVEGIKMYTNNSFPSGHSTTAFSIFCLLALIFTEKRYGILFFIAAILVAYSRVYLGEHFFADVYAGSILGVLTTVSVFYSIELYFKTLNKAWPESKLRFK